MRRRRSTRPRTRTTTSRHGSDANAVASRYGQPIGDQRGADSSVSGLSSSSQLRLSVPGDPMK